MLSISSYLSDIPESIHSHSSKKLWRSHSWRVQHRQKNAIVFVAIRALHLAS
ncbi:hypothetical protein [Chlorogloeopsis sp. ULAP02]|uniref:hypothetical protein n=1 Tax=Chlorogloeopsis sp. ULAP02 TaxID=3107926 RepID=UPI003135E5A4